MQFHSTIADDLVTHIERTLAALPPVTTMVREGCQPYDILQRALEGLPLEVVKQTTPVWHCHCSRDRVVRALIALGTEELRHLIAAPEETEVRCEFCTAAYGFDQTELVALLEEALQR